MTKLKLDSEEIIIGSKHQINCYFITRSGEQVLTMIIPINLFNDEYAKSKFREVIKTTITDEEGQYYFNLISNLHEGGIVLDNTKAISLECSVEFMNLIMIKSFNYVKNVYQW